MGFLAIGQIGRVLEYDECTTEWESVQSVQNGAPEFNRRSKRGFRLLKSRFDIATGILTAAKRTATISRGGAGLAD